jgi:hypothetical protein
MRFFFPGANDTTQAQERFRAIQDRAGGEVGAVKSARIYSLRFEQDGALRTISVGGTFSRADNHPILAIFETPEAFYVYTGVLDTVDGPPVRIGRERVKWAEEFTDQREGASVAAAAPHGGSE